MQFQHAILLSFALVGAVLALPSPYTIGETTSLAGGKCSVHDDGKGHYTSTSKCIKATGTLGIGSCCWKLPDVGSLTPQTFEG